MADPVKPAEDAQKKTDLPANETPEGQGDKPAESQKPAEGSQPGAGPEGGKGVDLENKVRTLEGLLRATQKEGTEYKRTIQTLTERLEATEKDLGESLEAMAKSHTSEPPQEDTKPGERPSAIAGILDRRKQREAEAKAKASTGSAATAVRFVALVEGAGLSLDDPRLAEAKAAATPDEGIEKVKGIIKDIREAERKAGDDRFNQLAEEVKGLKEKLLIVDTSGPSGGAIPQGTPMELAVAAYANKPKRR